MCPKKFLFLFLCVVFYFSPPSRAFASTVINTDIVADTTWTISQSPYIVNTEITVTENATLAIDPGVIVKLDYDANIFVLGSLAINGAVSKKVSVSSLYDSIGADLYNDCLEYMPDLVPEEGVEPCANTNQNEIDFPWLFESSGIIAEGAHNISFSNTLFSHLGNYGLSFSNTFIAMDNVQIFDTPVGLYIYNSDIDISNSTFENIYDNDVIELYERSVAEISNVNVKSSFGYGGLTLYGSKARIVDSIFEGLGKEESDSAIEIYDEERYDFQLDRRVVIYRSELNASGLKIKGHESGLEFYGGMVNIEKTKIFQNYTGVETYLNDGSTVVITESSIVDNDYATYISNKGAVNVANNYWGDPTGPFEPTLNPEGKGGILEHNGNNITFIPWLTSDPLEGCVTDCFSNVLFLPGIEASRLYTKRADGSEDQLWEPNRNLDIEKLYLNTDGTSIDSDVYTRDIIEETNTPVPLGFAGQNIYKSFADTMGELMDDFKIAAWQPFPYDWRQSPEEVVNTPQKLPDGETVSLVDTLQSLVNSSKNDKVTIVAHSKGGLVAKALLKKLQNDKDAGINNLIDSVDALILVAVPQIGTAQAVPAILHGFDQDIAGGVIMDKIHAREFGRNMKGAFSLLPSREYINRVSASPVTFVDTIIPSNVTTKLVQTFGSAIDSYAEYKDFLFGGEGRTDPLPTETNLPISLSENLFSQAENLHNEIDAWTPPASLRVIEVAGWGLDTVASFEYYPREDCGGSSCKFVLDERPRFTSDGDKTVVVPSAHYMSFSGSGEKYWVDFKNYNTLFRVNREHKNILEVAQLNNFIQSILEKKDIVLDTVLKDTQPTYTGNLLRLSIHSPVTIDAYDLDGNHTGKICPSGSEFCYKEENILNSSYLEFGEGKYINLPEDQMSKVKLQGTDIGTFTYNSERVLPDGTSSIFSFIDIPVTTQTQAEITINQNGTPQLALDVTGDGVTDFTIQPNNEFDPILYLKIMKETINSFDLQKSKKNKLNKRIDNIIKAIQKGKINKAELKAEKFKSVLEKKLSKPDPKKPKPKKLSKTDAQLLLDMLNKLLDNIG